jgi:large subunit ribosomal protein L4
MSSQKLQYDIYSQQGEKIKQVELNPAIFGVEINQALVHQAAMAQMSASRKVLAHTKDRSEVHGGGRKPWRQKGTGRARHGSIRSPLWKGGGVTFGPSKDRNFVRKINKKMKRKALFMCLTDRAQDKNLVLVDKFDIQNNKTKEFVEIIKNLKDALKLKKINKKKIDKKVEKKEDKKPSSAKTAGSEKKFDIKDYKTSILLVSGKNTAKISRVARNIAGVRILGANSLNVVDILAHKNLLISQDGLEVIEKTYLK